MAVEGSRRLLATLAVAAILVAACDPSASPAASAGAGPSGSPTAASGEPSAEGSPAGSAVPSPTAEATPAPPSPLAGLRPHIAARVTVAALNVRESPATSAKRSGTLSKGDIVVLTGYGGIKAGGYVWFEAGRLAGVRGALPALPAWPLEGGDWSDLTGWIAVGNDSEAYVKPLAPRCSDAAATDLATLSAMLLGEQLACLDDTPLVLQGTWGCGGCGGAFAGTFTPAWLAEPLSGVFSVNWSERVGPTQLYFPRGVDRPTEGTILRVHGHLSDRRASKCEVAIPTSEGFDAPLVAIRARDAVAWCQEHIVVDSYEVIGTDPSFTPG
jgi:hypothetical protein